MSQRVLVVDDDSQMLKAITDALTARGYEVLTAGNGEVALSLAAEEDLDLVLLDLGLPGIEGHEVIRRLRAWTELPVIIISVRESQEEKAAALDAGADDFVTKPFGMKELLARMRAVRRRAAGEDEIQPILRFDGLEVDLLTKLVKLDGHAVHLTPTEYRLLEAMATNPGKLLTYTWPREGVGSWLWYGVELPALYVRQIRQKLGDIPSSPRWITTEPGLGYRWLQEPAGPLPPVAPRIRLAHSTTRSAVSLTSSLNLSDHRAT